MSYSPEQIEACILAYRNGDLNYCRAGIIDLLTAYAATLRQQAARVDEDVRDRVAKAIADVIGHGMREKCYPHADAALEAALSAQPAQHPDDAAVDRFAAAMKEKLAAARAKGRGGWQDKHDCPQQRLSNMLRDHVEKGDPRDVANFCMFLHERGESIIPGKRAQATMTADATDAMVEAAAKFAHDHELPAKQFYRGLWKVMLAAQPAERQGDAIDSAASWPEDAGTENGDYECVCASCGRHFIGYKRRVTCRLCHTHPAAPVGVPDGFDIRVEDTGSPRGEPNVFTVKINGHRVFEAIGSRKAFRACTELADNLREALAAAPSAPQGVE